MAYLTFLKKGTRKFANYNEYKCLSCYLKDKLGTEDILLMSLDMDFIKNYYNWMLSVRGLAKSTSFERVNTLKWLMYLAMDEGWIHKHPFKKFVCKPEYKKRPFLSEEDLLPTPFPDER